MYMENVILGLSSTWWKEKQDSSGPSPIDSTLNVICALIGKIDKAEPKS